MLNLRRGLQAAALPLLVLALWALCSAQSWVAEQVLPPPQDVAQALWDGLQSGELWTHARLSLWRVLCGFSLGAVLGLALGTLMGFSARAKDCLYPSLQALAQVPLLAWLPLLMLWLGVDEALKLVLMAKAAAIPVALNTLSGIEQVPASLREVAQALRLTRLQTLKRLVLPAALGPISTGLRYGMTQAWLALVVAELLASSEGLGFMLVYSRQLFQADRMLAAVAVIGLMGWGLDLLLARLEQRLSRWQQEGAPA